ncbi:hypothetical protein [Pedobacter faecalis]|uniref:hypothetical protein n=1 Tax=Pedobacter faecalis TaxID=3041495 RepID=UPI00254DC9EB|nr:hypothetical protein [Pedobacter sp. ELA7]
MTLQDYISWLATNPSFEEMAVQSRSLTRKAIDCCNRMLRAIRKAAKRVSCLWRKSRPTSSQVAEPTSAAPQGIRSTEVPSERMPADWGDHPDANYQYRADRMRANVEEELAQEERVHKAIEIIINRRKA